MAKSANSSSFEKSVAHVVSLYAISTAHIVSLVVSTSSKKFVTSVTLVVLASFVASEAVRLEMSEATASLFVGYLVTTTVT
uniref:Uncharacterized protein n=1 Tax=Cannabis sativa TaxID=3483 RepID=A0A803PBB7_CANSA